MYALAPTFINFEHYQGDVPTNRILASQHLRSPESSCEENSGRQIIVMTLLGGVFYWTGLLRHSRGPQHTSTGTAVHFQLVLIPTATPMKIEDCQKQIEILFFLFGVTSC